MKKALFILMVTSIPCSFLYKTFLLEGETVPTFTLASSAFSPAGIIPHQYTCDGANFSPELSWQHAPSGTQSFVLIVDDLDAQAVVGKTFVHWIIINIPAEMNHLTQGASLKNVGQAQELANDYGKSSYSGPCPPAHAEHNYHFTLFALNTNITSMRMNAPFTAEAFRMEFKPAIIGEALLVGRYTKL